VAAAVSRSVEALGGVDGFVHAAGAVSPDPLGSLTDENWRRVVDVNLTAYPFAVQALLEPLRVAAAAAAVEGSASTGPGVVGISSIEGLVGNAAIPAYCASKSGLLARPRPAGAVKVRERQLSRKCGVAAVELGVWYGRPGFRRGDGL